MQTVTLVGRAASDAELKRTNGGQAMARFRMAVNTGPRSAEKTNWWTVTVFGASADNMAKWVTKGREVVVTGRMEVREYEQQGVQRYSLEVVASEWTLVGGQPQGQRPQYDQQRRQARAAEQPSQEPLPAADGWGTNDGNIPF